MVHLGSPVRIGVVLSFILPIAACGGGESRRKGASDDGDAAAGGSAGGAAGSGGTAVGGGAGGSAGGGPGAGGATGGTSGSGGVDAGAGGSLDAGSDASVADGGPDVSVPDGASDAGARCVPVEAGTGWGVARLLSDSLNDADEGPRVGIDPQGNVGVLWTQLDAGRVNYDIAAAFYTPSGGWATAGLAETDSIQWAFSEGGGIGPIGGGNFVAVWSGLPSHPYANSYTVGTGWGPTVLQLDQATSGTQAPELATSGSGAGIAIWRESNAVGGVDVMASLFSGGTPAAPVRVSRNVLVGMDYARVAMNASGDAIVVWAEVDTLRRNVYARMLVGGNWQAPTQVNTNSTGDADTPRVALNASGDAMVVFWQLNSEGVPAPWARPYTAGNWGTAEVIGTTLVNNVHVAFDAAGNAIAVWDANSDSLRGNYSIRAARYEKGVGWGAQHVLSAPDDEAGNATIPSLAMDAAGNAVVTWATGKLPDPAASVWANRYHAGIGWSCPEVIETGLQGALLPVAAMNAAGQAVIAWRQQSVGDGVHGIWANMLE